MVLPNLHHIHTTKVYTVSKWKNLL